MRFIDILAVRLFFWFVLPLLLVVLVVGPARFWRFCKRSWNWVWEKRLDPQEILSQIVRQHEEHVAALKKVLTQAEAAEAEIARNLRQSGENVTAFEREARQQMERADELGARAALYKVNLEKLTLQNFQEQRERQRGHIEETRRRLYLMELQLRQYEVGRSILLSQLAEARTVEQQYAIARKFDPYSAVANWQKAEGLVQEQTLNARAVEQVYVDTADMPLAGQPAQVDPGVLDSQLAELRTKVERRTTNGHK